MKSAPVVTQQPVFPIIAQYEPYCKHLFDNILILNAFLRIHPAFIFRKKIMVKLYFGKKAWYNYYKPQERNEDI